MTSNSSDALRSKGLAPPAGRKSRREPELPASPSRTMATGASVPAPRTSEVLTTMEYRSLPSRLAVRSPLGASSTSPGPPSVPSQLSASLGGSK